MGTHRVSDTDDTCQPQSLDEFRLILTHDPPMPDRAVLTASVTALLERNRVELLKRFDDSIEYAAMKTGGVDEQQVGGAPGPFQDGQVDARVDHGAAAAQVRG